MSLKPGTNDATSPSSSIQYHAQNQYQAVTMEQEKEIKGTQIERKEIKWLPVACYIPLRLKTPKTLPENF